MEISAPSKNALKLASKLFANQEEREFFLNKLATGDAGKDAIIWLDSRESEARFECAAKPDWAPEFVDVLIPNQHVGKSSAHEQGKVYCLDLSSIFSASSLSVLDANSSKVLDLCAAPGGKGIFCSRLLKPETLVFNEVIGKRLPALTSNLTRCQIPQSLALSQDPERLAEMFPNAFNLLIVDAPCSGQSLLARGQESQGCFHPATINMNSNRQKRITANATKMLASGGVLAYMTCTFSPEENEAVVAWLLKKFPVFKTLEVPALAQFQSKLSDNFCYRLFPQDGYGAGAFVSLLRREDSGYESDLDLSLLPRIIWQSVG